MTPGEAASLVVAAASLLTAIGTLVVSIATALRLSTVHQAVNGQTDRLVDLTATSSFARGVQAEREDASHVGKLPSPYGIPPHKTESEFPTYK